MIELGHILLQRHANRLGRKDRASLNSWACQLRLFSLLVLLSKSWTVSPCYDDSYCDCELLLFGFSSRQKHVTVLTPYHTYGSSSEEYATW